MIQLVIFIVFALFICSATTKRSSGSTSGLSFAIEIELAPYMAAIASENSFEASGAIITQNHILTIAHAFSDNPGNLTVRVGSRFYVAGGDVYGVARIHFHPKYQKFNFDYDFSIMELFAYLQFSDAVSPVRLPAHHSYIANKEILIVSGWGDGEHLKEYRGELGSILLPKTNIDKCQEAYAGQFMITERMICLGGYIEGNGLCIGDEGAPAVKNGILVGIASFGKNCDRKGFPSVFGSVSAVMNWLEGIVSNE